jgi:hypothetical protein
MQGAKANFAAPHIKQYASKKFVYATQQLG